MMRYLTVVSGASKKSSWSEPITFAPFRASTPTTFKPTPRNRNSLPSGDSEPNSFSASVWPIKQTGAELRTSSVVNGSPSATGQFRTVRKSGVEPRILPGRQLWLPATTWPHESTLGATACNALHSRRNASASSIVMFMLPPWPVLTPPTDTSIESIWMTLAPRLLIARSIDCEDPPPISIIAITAATPMMMPRQVSVERSTFRRKARKAIRKVWMKLLMPLKLSPPFWQKRIFQIGRRHYRFACHHFVAFMQVLRSDGRVRAVCKARNHFDGPHEFSGFHPNDVAVFVRGCRRVLRFGRNFRVGRRRPAQRGVWHQQGICLPAHLKAHVGRQVRQQHFVRIFDVDLDGVEDDVLRHRRVEAHLADHTLKLAARKSVHRKGDGHAGFDAAHVGFVDCGPDLHLGQIPRDEKQTRCVQARDHGLADVHAPVNDDAADRRIDGAEIEVALGFFKVGLRLRHAAVADRNIRLRDFVVGLGSFEVRLRNQFALVERLLAFPIRLGLGELGFHLLEVGNRT